MSNTTEAARHWFIVGRWQEFAGEGRANLLRMLGLGVFYGVQLVEYYAARMDAGHGASRDFHRQATLIVVTWSLVAIAVLVCLQRRMFPATVKYLSTAADVLLLTLLVEAAGGARTPLVQVYYLIIGLAALRFSVGLIAFATVASMAGYLGLVALADKQWFDTEHATPVVEQLLTLAGLALAGVIAGQVVRQTQHMALDYAARTSASRETTLDHA